MIKKNAKNIILVLFVVITGIFYIDSFMRSGIEEDFFTDIYLYLWNCNLNIVFTIVFLVVFQELCVMDSYKKYSIVSIDISSHVLDMWTSIKKKSKQ